MTGWRFALFLTVVLGIWALMHGEGVLRDRWVELVPGLVLAGVDDLTAREQYGQTNGAVEKALAARPPGAAILLSHSPLESDRAAAAGANLMLSGRTHAGQIWPFRYLVQLKCPFIAGRYPIGDMPLIVCRGAGTWGPPMRLWSPCEILRLKLRSPLPRLCLPHCQTSPDVTGLCSQPHPFFQGTNFG